MKTFFVALVAFAWAWSPITAFVPSARERVPGALQASFLDELLKKTSISSRPKVKVPDGFVVPEPKPLTIAEGTDMVEFGKSSLSLAARLGTGAFTLGWKIDSIFFDDPEKYSLKLGPLSIRDSSTVLDKAPRPSKPLILYQYDGSPFCKRVREMINLLDLTVEYRPCPGARQGAFSDELFERTGRRTVPYLVDPNTGFELFESGDQIEYLLNNYGPPASEFDRKALWPITFEAFSITTSTIVAILRGFPGSKRQANARPDNERMEPLELWGYESSPFVRPVREKLDALCLPHVMVSCSRGSANRDRMVTKTGRFQVPFLVDPNTGLELFEGNEIVKYLDAVYTTP
jgi:glutathione S-transferase